MKYINKKLTIEKINLQNYVNFDEVLEKAKTVESD